jgi:hypothetical protein
MKKSQRINMMQELKKRFIQSRQQGRKILGKNLQGHSPIYE